MILAVLRDSNPPNRRPSRPRLKATKAHRFNAAPQTQLPHRAKLSGSNDWPGLSGSATNFSMLRHVYQLPVSALRERPHDTTRVSDARLDTTNLTQDSGLARPDRNFVASNFSRMRCYTDNCWPRAARLTALESRHSGLDFQAMLGSNLRQGICGMCFWLHHVIIDSGEVIYGGLGALEILERHHIYIAHIDIDTSHHTHTSLHYSIKLFVDLHNTHSQC